MDRATQIKSQNPERPKGIEPSLSVIPNLIREPERSPCSVATTLLRELRGVLYSGPTRAEVTIPPKSPHSLMRRLPQTDKSVNPVRSPFLRGIIYLIDYTFLAVASNGVKSRQTNQKGGAKTTTNSPLIGSFLTFSKTFATVPLLIVSNCFVSSRQTTALLSGCNFAIASNVLIILCGDS